MESQPNVVVESNGNDQVILSSEVKETARCKFQLPDFSSLMKLDFVEGRNLPS